MSTADKQAQTGHKKGAGRMEQKMNGRSWMKRLLAVMTAAVMFCLLPGAGLAVRADYENVLDGRYYQNEYLVIRKDPTGKVGKTMNIPVIIQARNTD